MNKYFSLFIILLITLAGCFSKDDPQPLKPFAGVVATATNSIYTHQTFYSLTQEFESNHNEINAWDIGLETGEEGQNIIINSGDNLYVCNLGPVDFTTTIQIPNDTEWTYDASSGNTDSLAIRDWVNTSAEPYIYTDNVYVIAEKDVFQKYYPIKKIKFIELTDSSYTFISDILENSEHDTTTILKDNDVNFVKLDLSSSINVVDIEPSSKDWDIQFTQYASIIPDDFGVATPYMLRGTYINSKRISVAKYYINTNEVAEYPDNKEQEESLLQEYFESDIIQIPHDSLFSSNWDAIGYEWKEVTIDENANTAVYKADIRRVYFVKEIASNKIYKMRFFSYYTDGVRGYPWFQYGAL